MRYLVILFLLSLAANSAFARDQHVRGHFRKDGTWVEPHHRTAPNGTTSDNYSSYPNTNPYTGREGRVDPLQAQIKKKQRRR